MPGLPARERAPLAHLSLSLLLLGAAACAHAPARPAGEDFVRPLQRLRPVGPTPFRPAALPGQVVLVHFFATWCFPCLQELPNLSEFQRRYGERGFTVVGVAMDLDGARVVEPFADSYALPYPLVLASEVLINGQTSYSRIKELPTTVLLGRDGRVRAAWTGLAPPSKVAALVEDSLEEKAR